MFHGIFKIYFLFFRMLTLKKFIFSDGFNSTSSNALPKRIIFYQTFIEVKQTVVVIFAVKKNTFQKFSMIIFFNFRHL